MCASIDAASGGTCTTVTSSPASLTYSLNAIKRGSLASMNSTRCGTRPRSRSSLPALRRLVAMKMKGDGMGGSFPPSVSMRPVGPGPDASAPRPCSVSGRAERPAQERDRLGDGGPGGVGSAQRIEHHEVMDDALVARGRHVHARLTELACVRLTLVAQDIGLGGDHERLRKADKFLRRRPQRRGGDFGALVLVAVLVPEPLHRVTAQEVALGELLVRVGVQAGVCNRVEQELR